MAKPKRKKKRGSNPFSLASSILDRNATECFATRNVAGAGTASGFSRVLDPWKTAIKRFISTPLLRVQPSFLPPSNVSSFFPRRWDTRVWCLPSVLTSSHLSLSLFLSLKYPLHPCNVSTAYGYVYFPLGIVDYLCHCLVDVNLLVHKDDVSKRRMFRDGEGMQIRTECWLLERIARSCNF